VKEEIGGEVPVGCLIAGPFTAATSCYPTEKLLRATRKESEKVHELLRFVTEGLKLIYKEFIKEGMLILLCDPLASGTLLHRKQYLEFALPYTKELMQSIHDNKGMVCYHICGDTTNTVADMATSGCDMISVDNIVDLEQVKNTAGQKLPILGNVSPIDYFIQGTTEMMEEAVKVCLRKAWDSPNGYILASGCDLSGNVPLENIETFMNAARKYGRYPLDPKNFQ
jgi:uroporphyrinogen decarboxylase